MLTVYNPATGANQTTAGAVSAEVLLLNLLIEQRVTNAILLDAQYGTVTQTLDQYRSDAVNATVNPAI